MTTIDEHVALPPEPTSVAAARRFVAQVLRGCDVDMDVVSLLVSELATNAVLHARSTFQVAVGIRGDRVRITVSDGSGTLPVRKHYRQDSVTGRGLTMVASTATDWGVEQRPRGKAIWFEVAIARERTMP